MTISEPGYDGSGISCCCTLKLQLLSLVDVDVVGGFPDLGWGLDDDLNLVTVGQPVHVLGFAPVTCLIVFVHAHEF